MKYTVKLLGKVNYNPQSHYLLWQLRACLLEPQANSTNPFLAASNDRFLREYYLINNNLKEQLS